jgi:glycosyltransferase involved in cell wall biosynthesis
MTPERTDTMEASVIVACFNGAKTLPDVFEGLASQQLDARWEVVFVDNGSTDDSIAVAERWRDRLPDLRIVNAHTPGTVRQSVAHSYATGMRAARGRCLLLHDADDQTAPGWLQAMVRALREHEFVAASMDYRHLNSPWLIHESEPQSRGLIVLKEMGDLPFAYGCTFGLRRTVPDRIGWPEPSCGTSTDIDYCRRAQQVGIDIHFVADAVLRYRLRSDWRSQFSQGRGYGRGHVLIRAKYGGLTPHAASGRREYWRVVGLALYRALQAPKWLATRRRRAAWFWCMGWCLGVMDQLLPAPWWRRGSS